LKNSYHRAANFGFRTSDTAKDFEVFTLYSLRRRGIFETASQTLALVLFALHNWIRIHLADQALPTAVNCYGSSRRNARAIGWICLHVSLQRSSPYLQSYWNGSNPTSFPGTMWTRLSSLIFYRYHTVFIVYYLLSQFYATFRSFSFIYVCVDIYKLHSPTGARHEVLAV
jgi:hypothetical protein